jgi:hypothetical protein
LELVKKILSLEESRREVTCLKRACPARIPRRKEKNPDFESERRKFTWLKPPK